MAKILGANQDYLPDHIVEVAHIFDDKLELTSLVASEKEDTINKALDIESNKTSNTFFPTVKAVFDWVSGLFVKGAASSVDNTVARFDGTTGKVVQASSVTITDGGMVGIGTTPSELLDIYTSTGSAKILLRAPNGAALVRLKGILGSDWQVGTDAATGDFIFRDQANSETPFYIQRGSAANSLYIKNPGYIGIGLTSPTAKLDVNGTSRFRSSATFNEQIIDNSGSTGTDGQVLKKVGGLVLWSNQ